MLTYLKILEEVIKSFSMVWSKYLKSVKGFIKKNN